MTEPRCFAVLLIVILAAPLQAQIRQTTVRFEHLTVEDGLSDNELSPIMQDRQGFLWIGTINGLNRYDGYEFTVFKQDAADPNSLADNTVLDILEARDGTFWFAGFAGLTRFDPATGIFTRYAGSGGLLESLPSTRYGDVLEDRAGHIWAAASEKGLYRIDPETNAVARITDEPGDAGSSWSGLVETRDGGIWSGNAATGLHRYDPATETISRHLDEELAPGGAFPMFEDEAGALWLAGSGVHRYDPATGTLDHFLPDPSAPASARKNHVKTLYQDRWGRIWAGMSSNGLFRFDSATETFTHFAPDPADHTSLRGGTVRRIYEDRNRVLWIGGGGGLNRLDPRREAVTRLTYPSLEGFGSVVHEGHEDDLWIGSDEGVTRLDRGTGMTTHYWSDAADPNRLSSNFVTFFYAQPGEAGVLWIGHLDGSVDRLDARSGTVDRHRFRAVPVGFDAPVRGIYVAPQRPDELWVALSLFGLCRLKTGTGAQTCFEPDPDASNSLPNPNVAALEPDRADPGVLWIGTDGGGLSRFDTATETFSYHVGAVPDDTTSLSVSFVSSLHASRAEPGVLWVGTWGGGLNRFDTATGRVTRVFTERNSDLPSDVVGVIAEDAAGSIWVGTRQGVARLDPVTGTIKYMNTHLGLPLKHDVDIEHGRSGELIIGMRDAVYRFDPARIALDALPPPVVLTEMRLFDQPVVPGPDSPLRQPLAFSETIRLPYRQRDVTFSYAALDFTDPARNRYAFRLDGYDKDWRNVGVQRSATYTNLPPGSYTFRVKAANSYGIWNEEGTAVELTILPPWWRSWWSYGLYGLLLLAGIVTIDRWQRRRLISKERERIRERELKQAREIERAYTELKTAKDRLVQQEKMASLGALTAGIAHEIKNPLNFVNNFAGLARGLSEELREEIDALADGIGADEKDAAMKNARADLNQNGRYRAASRHISEIRDMLSDLATNTAKIEEHGQRADLIVRSMMQHARGGSGQRETVDLNALVSEYLDLAYHGKRAQTPDFHTDIERDLAPDVGRVEIVPQDVGRVLINLLGNAFDAVYDRAAQGDEDYMPLVTVSTRRVNDQAEILVKDNGPGIPAPVKARIFEPFFTTKPTGLGTGLGLSMSYDIVTQGHGGSLLMESEEGEGATFIVSLPDTQAEPRDERHAP